MCLRPTTSDSTQLNSTSCSQSGWVGRTRLDQVDLSYIRLSSVRLSRADQSGIVGRSDGSRSQFRIVGVSWADQSMTVDGSWRQLKPIGIRSPQSGRPVERCGMRSPQSGRSVGSCGIRSLQKGKPVGSCWIRLQSGKPVGSCGIRSLQSGRPVGSCGIRSLQSGRPVGSCGM